MATAVGDITISGTNVVGSTYQSADLGFTPTLAIFWWSGRDATGAALQNSRRGFGVSGGATINACHTTFSQDGAANAVEKRISHSDACVAALNNSGANAGKADVQSFASNRITLEVLTQFAAGMIVSFFATDAATAGSVIDVTEPATVSTVNYTPAGGEPDALLVFGVGATAHGTGGGGSRYSIGWGLADLTQVVVAGAGEDGAATMDTGTYNRTGDIIAAIALNVDSIDARAQLVGHTGGFGFNWVARAGTRKWLAVPVYGGTWALGNFTMRTDGADIPVTVSGFTGTPAGVLCMTCRNASTAESTAGTLTDTGSSHDRLAIGAFTSPSSRTEQDTGSIDGSADADVYAAHSTAAVLVAARSFTDVSALSVCDVSALANGSFTMVMDIPDPAESRAYYLALEGGVVGGSLARSFAVICG